MPEIGIFDSPEPNAFATGARRNAALVAVSSGLLQRMGREEVEAVVGHEMTHVANGDMVTLTLIQGVVNPFVIFLSRVIGGFISRSDDGRGGGAGYFITVIVLQLVFGILANMIVMWFSRHREFHADRGGAQLAGKKGVVIHPLACSGYGPVCEFVMRSCAIFTGGQFLFLTDDSGIGDSHATPRVPCFFVTSLSKAILRMVDVELTGKYREPDAGDVIRTGGDPQQRQETFYRVIVRTEKNFLGSAEHPLPIIPGMVTTVEVLTGEKSVLDYLVKPARMLRDEALRER